MIFDKNGNLLKENLKELLKTYYMAIDVSIRAVDKSGNILDSMGNSMKFCSLCNKHSNEISFCKNEFCKASKQSMNIGEPYFFFCPMDFMHIAIPLLNNNVFWGGLIAGPISIKELDNKLIDLKTKKISTFSSNESHSFSKYVQTIPIIDISKIKYLGDILFMITSLHLKESKSILDEKKQRMKQQSRINEEVQLTKAQPNKDYLSYYYEKNLYIKVKNGNNLEAKNILNKLLAFIYLNEGHNIDIIKTRMIELCSLLSRAAIEGGANLREMMAFNYLLFEDLKTIKDLNNLSFWMLKVLDYYSECVVNIPSSKNKDIIKRAISYINSYYNYPLKLKEVADYVHLNPSYFSTLFKKETGVSFSKYIQKIRIEESKCLLANTQDTIPNIAISVGFNDQSYFTKTFKKVTGFTPRQYRIEY
ncbi:helix-turn-helix domain-containing protein [Maledivibacter halophilus]|uniref:AraC-type DNA-binding protein n=1 Tax=Maledivibacter halophilus TaxID=36842 RepID=A0A1T5IKS8_9FIRM|nr:helix-turn-helix domain-containing protein [Maledivibacter halophilus]SKC39710.1 AraC-type DNA-binding protein [Maledivibacter halophilus]